MATNWENKKKRIEQIDFLLSTMNDPVYVPEAQNFSSLNEAFETSNPDLIGLDRCGITMAVLNFHYLKTGKAENSDASYAVQNFMRSIQQYLPIKLRSDCWGRWGWALTKVGKSANGPSKEMLDKFDELRDWIFNFRDRIENDLTSKYLMGAKPQYIETLKRRFKQNWSEKIETENETNNHVDGGLNVEIKFTDA